MVVMCSALNASHALRIDSSDSGSSSSNASQKLIDKRPVTRGSGKLSSRSNNTRRKKKLVTVCLTNCHYDVVRRVTSKLGYKEVGETDNWNLYWTDWSITIERCKEMKRFQRINHFPGMLEICRKDLLARNLNRMQRLFPKDYNFFPKSWCFPADLGEAMSYSRLRKNKTFILKPDTGCQGRGIALIKNLKDVRPSDRMVCQAYIAKPFLIDGYKFDLRLYTLITSCDPLRIYVYKEGLARFATSRYKEPNGVNITNIFMHLTNYAVNKHSRTYNMDTEAGSKRKLSWLRGYLHSMGHDVEKLWSQMDDIIIKSILCAWPILKHSYVACFPNHDATPACCELLGIDIILDRRLSPILLEVNHSPSFHTDTDLDCEIKEALLEDTFRMLALEQCDKRKIMRQDRKRIRERLLHGSNKDLAVQEPSSFSSYYHNELVNRGGFRIIYPVERTQNNFHKFFNQGQASLYNDTASSRARESAQAAMRDEMIMRAKLEAAKRVVPVPPKPVLVKPKTDTRPQANRHTIPSVPLPVSSSFLPQVIVESEEKERLQRLAQRDLIVRSNGLLEQLFLSLKRNGVLRPQDERKFAVFSKARSLDVVKVERKSPPISDLIDGIRTGEANLFQRQELHYPWGGVRQVKIARSLNQARSKQR